MTRLMALVLLLASSLACDASARNCQNYRHVRHFHVGPESECDPICEADAGYVYVEDGSGKSDVRKCGEWQTVYSHPCASAWREYENQCPLYDDYDIQDEYDTQASWPGKRVTSWMHELNYYR